MNEQKILPKSIDIIEVGPRDGLQNLPFIPTAAKRAFIMALRAAGLREIEATSFVHPQWVPQFQDAALLLAALPERERYMVLVPNRKGMEQALAAGATRIAFFTAASDTFSQKNTNTSIAGSFERMEDALHGIDRRALYLRIYVSTAFDCPYEGKVDPERVTDVVARCVALGAQEISIGDTIGKATPPDVDRLLARLLRAYPPSLFALHFHDTYRFALANVYQGLRMGITRYDSSAGGLGGCPYAPGAAGNVATEDIVSFAHQLGIKTGVDLEKVRAASAQLAAVLAAVSDASTGGALNR